MEEKNFFLKMWTTQLFSQNLYVKFIVIILCICLSYITAEEEKRIFSYEEEDHYGLESQPIGLGLNAYDDGTVVIRIVYDYNTTCYHDIFFLRIIYPNGTVIKKDIKLEGVQQFNYCNDDKKYEDDKLKYELIRMNQILITYKDHFNKTHVNVSGMIIDFDGNVLDRTYFRLMLIQHSLNLQLNINREKGFIIFDDLTYNADIKNPVISWQQYRIEPNGTFIKLTSGKFGLNFNGYKWYKIVTFIGMENDSMMPTVNEGYAYVYLLRLPTDRRPLDYVNNPLIAAVLLKAR